MRVLMRCALALLLFLFFVGGCAFFSFQPREDSEFRVPPLGMRIYNMSGSSIGEQEWQDVFRTIHFAARTFAKCAAPLDPHASGELFRRFIVIIPPEDIFILTENVGGFTDLRSVFLRRDSFYDGALRHEWLHLYLFLSGEWMLGDIFHFDPRFETCKYVSEDSDGH